MTGSVCERLAVVGLGLIGGSVALAAQQRGIAGEVRGVDRADVASGAIARMTLRDAARWADCIVIAVPPGAAQELFTELGSLVSEDVWITDVASVKQPLLEAARRALRFPERYVGAHPLAGGDRCGFSHARGDLFEGAACILTPTGTESADALASAEAFWRGLGTRTVRQSPAEHDRTVALLSHAPHLIAYAFACAFARESGSEALAALAGPGLRDFTRIARSSPELWSEILSMNREAVLEHVARFASCLNETVTALERGDRVALASVLRSGRAAVEKLER
jgi:prephenate dehydrogenase